MPFNEIADVRRKMQLFDDSLSDADIQKELSEAQRDVFTFSGRYFIERIIANDSLTYKTKFSELISVEKVEIDGTFISADKHDVDLENGSITFDENVLNECVEIKIFYTPLVYKDLELLYACLNILLFRLVQTADRLTEARYDAIKMAIERKERTLLTKAGLFIKPDHKISSPP